MARDVVTGTVEVAAVVGPGGLRELDHAAEICDLGRAVLKTFADRDLILV
jgi:hypothetical protein